MFSDRPLSHLAGKGEEDLKQVYRLYDISQVTKVGYGESQIAKDFGYANKLSNPDTALCFGGVRKTLYGNDCLLTKHSLFVPGNGIDLFPHVHFVNRARVADVSCVMLHYKLTSNALEIALQNKEGFVGNSKGYRDFIDLVLNNPKLHIMQDTAVELDKVNDLVEKDFLFLSRDFCEYVATASKDVLSADNPAARANACITS